MLKRIVISICDMHPILIVAQWLMKELARVSDTIQPSVHIWYRLILHYRDCELTDQWIRMLPPILSPFPDPNIDRRRGYMFHNIFCVTWKTYQTTIHDSNAAKDTRIMNYIGKIKNMGDVKQRNERTLNFGMIAWRRFSHHE